MKTIVKLLSITLLMILVVSQNAMSQEPARPGASPEMVENLKKEFLTSKLGLEEVEAAEFWKTYKEFEADRKALREKYVRPKNPMLLSDEEAENQLSQIFAFEEEMLNLKKDYFTKLEGTLNTRQLLYLHHLENEFRKEIIQKVRKRMATRNDQLNRRKRQ